MALSNTAVPRYYGEFRDRVLRHEIPVNKEISMEMNRNADYLLGRPMIITCKYTKTTDQATNTLQHTTLTSDVIMDEMSTLRLPASASTAASL